MQRHRVDALRQYLLLVRLPNAFTAPSNVLAGYLLAAQTPAGASGSDLASLMISSGLLYVAGIALNDYFDIEIDRRERPTRPIPSGRVPKKHALAIAIIAIAFANAMALAASLASLAVTVALTAAIIVYDYNLKRGALGPFVMAGTRFLNVILGASPLLFMSSNIGAVTLAGALLFAYIIAIMMLSRKEVGDQRPNVYAVFSIVAGVVVMVAAAGLLLHFQSVFLVNLVIFSAVMAATFWQLLSAGQSVQKAIRNMVLSIIIFDSIFVGAATGPILGLATLLLIVPAILLARKLYVT